MTANKKISNMKEYFTRPWSIKQLNTMNEKGNIQFDYYIQRAFTWNNEQQSLLIRSIITGFPKVPSIYANRVLETGVYQFLDGRQRVQTCLRFINDEFALSDIGSVKDRDGNEEDITGKKFSELSEDLQDIILSYNFGITYYENLTDEDIADLFFLLNNGKPLTPVEQDRSLCKTLEVVQEIAQHKLIKTIFTKGQMEKYKNEDFVVKSYIMLFKEDACLDRKYTQVVWGNINITPEEREIMEKVFDKVSEIIPCYKGETFRYNETDRNLMLRLERKLVKQTHLLSLLPVIRDNMDIKSRDYGAWLFSIMDSDSEATTIEAYNESCRSGTGKAANVSRRVKALRDSLESRFRN